MSAVVAAACVAAWAWLLAFRGGFWRVSARDDDTAPPPAAWPAVTIVVPARDEAALIATSIASLAAQDYPGPFRILLVDDGSSDGTAGVARAAVPGERLAILAAPPPPPGWTGKLAAVAHGVATASTRWLWLTDADIAHAPDTLRRLVARAEADRLVLNSAMVALRCETLAERAIVPAFVFFFMKLYPFGRVNDPARATAAAAGGSMLVEATTLAAAGGIAAIRGALIDDCAMGASMKRHGRIRLALTRRSTSLRGYGWRELFQMIARSAYAQLHYSPARLAGAVAGMSLVYLAPPALAILADGPARLGGAAAWAAMALVFQPTLRHYRRSPLWGAALPLIAAFFAAATLASGWEHHRGRGGMWKGRAQAAGMARA